MVFRSMLLWFWHVEYIVGLQAVLQRAGLTELGLVGIPKYWWLCWLLRSSLGRLLFCYHRGRWR